MSNIEFAARTALGLMPSNFDLVITADTDDLLTGEIMGVVAILYGQSHRTDKDPLWAHWYSPADWKNALEQVVLGGTVQEPEYEDSSTDKY